MDVYQQVNQAVEEFNKKNPHVILLVKQEVFGIVLCMDHKIACTRTNVAFTETELRSLVPNVKKVVTDVCKEMVSLLIQAQKTK